MVKERVIYLPPKIMIKKLHGPTNILHSHIINLIANEKCVLIELERFADVEQETSGPSQIFKRFAIVMNSENPITIDV